MITRCPNIRTRQAFTLAELTVVAVVLGVLSMIAIPRLGNTVERMRAEEGKQILMAVYAAQKRYWQEHGQTYTDDFDNLDIDMRPSTNFENIQLDASGFPLAQIDRANGTYTLTINEMGQMYCIGTICYELGLY